MSLEPQVSIPLIAPPDTSKVFGCIVIRGLLTIINVGIFCTRVGKKREL